ncbi:MAG: ABC transporter ATP-binding protein, partial [Methanocalculus sp. MSAO_Arc2]
MFSVIALSAVVLYVSTGGDFLLYIGLFGTFMLALYRLVPAATQAQTNLTSMVQFLAVLELIYGELSREDGEREKRAKRGEGQPFAFRDSIRFQGVFFRYPDATWDTIRDVSFEIKKNTTVAIVG